MIRQPAGAAVAPALSPGNAGRVLANGLRGVVAGPDPSKQRNGS